MAGLLQGLFDMDEEKGDMDYDEDDEESVYLIYSPPSPRGLVYPGENTGH